MKKPAVAPIRVALYGMDPRSQKTLELYLKGPCQGIAVVVDEALAEVDIIDADFATAGDILQQRRQQNPRRLIILLSLQTLNIADTLFVKKPVNAEDLIAALRQVKSLPEVAKPVEGPRELEPVDPLPTAKTDSGDGQVAAGERPKKKTANPMASFLGTLPGVDFNDPAQVLNASYDPKSFFLGYVQSAYKVAKQERRSKQLNSIWKPLLILPEIQQIWLDADDKQLRVFAGMEQSRMFGSNISLTSVDAAALGGKTPDKFQDMEAFLWKLTIWTSKGRFPLGMDLNKPVFLKRWPNFTRLLVTPDALRISGLLMQGARAPLEIARVLNISPQYVLVFISACHNAGLLGFSERRSDELLAPARPTANPKQGLLSKILSKLRGE